MERMAILVSLAVIQKFIFHLVLKETTSQIRYFLKHLVAAVEAKVRQTKVAVAEEAAVQVLLGLLRLKPMVPMEGVQPSKVPQKETV